ncbi:ATP-binding protein [Desulfobacterota bacterium M19]
MAKAKILYIDDEKINLSNFAASFKDEFEVITAISGNEGLDIFRVNHDIAVIVADQRMPGMSGVEMLTRIYEMDPDPIRIILTGYINPQDIILAINQGHIHQYINKPWNIDQVRSILCQAVDKYQLTRENKRLLKVLAEKNEALQRANKQLIADIDLQARLERQNREAEIKMMSQAKMASLGQIATGIAHEINQPLTFIKIALESTARDVENQALNITELLEDINESQKQIRRITLIIDHLRTFGRNGSDEQNPVNMPEALDCALILFKQKIKAGGVELRISGADNLPLVNANISKLEQVFTNLIQNSMDALEDVENGRIEVDFQSCGQQVITRFIDNGQGMAPEVREKVFEPFFSTKETGRGTGLGLSIIYGIVSELNGIIDCESTLGRGCTFTITLPVLNTDSTE